MTLDNKRIKIIIISCLAASFFVGSYFIVTQEIANVEQNLTTAIAERASNVKEKFVLIQSFIETLRDNMQQSLTWQAEVKELHGALDSFVDYPDLDITFISKEKSMDKNRYWHDISGVVIATGSKKELSEESKNEISATIQMQSIFKNAVNTIPDLIWTYYVSKQAFRYYFPYYDPKLMPIDKDVFEKEYWIKASTANNPDRHMVMTDVYADGAGKGYMVTFSIPIYNNDSMKGIVAIDISLVSINELISEDLQIGSSFLLDEKNTILAAESDNQGQLLYVPQLISDDKVIYNDKNGYDYISYEIIQDEVRFIHRFSQLAKNKTAFANSLWEIFFLLVSMVMAYMIYYSRILVTRVETLANTDPLTTLLNRRAMKNAALPLMSLNKRYKQKLCFILADIDYFKKVNDTYGHAVGDDVLVTLTSILNSCLRSSDLLSRHGGEEFLIVLPQTDLESGYLLAERIRTSIENTRTGEQKIAVTISLGCVEVQGDEDFDSAITRADKMLYKAKSDGRNQTVVHTI
jgi:diguanylate cyclase (GGDEF)-like protein